MNSPAAVTKRATVEPLLEKRAASICRFFKSESLS